MAEETKPTTESVQGGDPTKQTTPEVKTEGKPQPGPVPYERFKEINEKAIQMEKELKKLQEAEKKREETAQAEQGKWKELYEKRDAEYKQLKTRQDKIEVAADLGLPLELIDRLKGETLEEIRKDAESMLDFLKPQEGPGLPYRKRHSNPPDVLDLSKMTPEEIRKNQDKIKHQSGLK